MAIPEYLEIIKQGVRVWEKWRGRTNILAVHMGFDLVPTYSELSSLRSQLE